MSGLSSALRQKASDLKSKGKQDVRRARRAATVDLEDLKRRARQDVKTGRRLASRKASDAKSGLKQDLRKAERSASKKKSDVTRKAKQDVKAADRAIMRASAGGVAKKAARAVGDGLEASVETGAAPAGDDRDTRAIADRARAAGEARAPIDATIDPMGNPRAMEAFATAGYGSADDAMEALVFGGGIMRDDETAGSEEIAADSVDSVAFFSADDAGFEFFGTDDTSGDRDRDRDAFGFELGSGGGDNNVWF